MMHDKAHSLYDLLINVRRAIALNFDEPIWIKAEVAQRSSSNGHVYLTLVEKETATSRLKAKAEASIWKTNLRTIRKDLKQPIGDLLAIGSEIAILAEVTYHEVYGFRLSIIDIDERFTLGQLELQRLETIDRLKKEDLLDRNKQLPIPMVWQRIAVVSAANAAGYADFRAELDNNPNGFQISQTFFDSAVQGERVKENFVRRLEEIAKHADEFDLVLLLRGGGSKLDLRGFDDFDVCKAIALSPIPVMTGIGHETDQAVADIVAALSVKTPTAAAHSVLSNLITFENGLLDQVKSISDRANTVIRLAKDHLVRSQQGLQHQSQMRIQNERNTMATTSLRIHQSVRLQMRREQAHFETAITQLTALNPKATLRRGYTLTTNEKKEIVTNPSSLEKGDQMTTHWHDGTVMSEVVEITSNE